MAGGLEVLGFVFGLCDAYMTDRTSCTHYPRTVHEVLQLVPCLGREWIFLTRGRAFLLVNLIQNLVLGLRLGSINYHISIKAKEALGQWGSTAL